MPGFDIVVEIPNPYPLDPTNPLGYLRQPFNPEPLFCLCGGIDDDTPMIECSNCADWFHFRCIGVAPETAENIGFYACPVCTKELSQNVTHDEVFLSHPHSSLSHQKAIDDKNGLKNELQMKEKVSLRSRRNSKFTEEVNQIKLQVQLVKCYECQIPIEHSQVLFCYNQFGERTHSFCSPKCRRTFRRFCLESLPSIGTSTFVNIQKDPKNQKDVEYSQNKLLININSMDRINLFKSNLPMNLLPSQSLSREKIQSKITKKKTIQSTQSTKKDTENSLPKTPSPVQTLDSTSSGKYTEIIRRNVRLGFESIFKSFDLPFNPTLPERLEASLWTNFCDSLHNQTGNTYRTKYRSLSYNLKDSKNTNLRDQITKELISTDSFVKMSPEELANHEMSREIQRLQEENLRVCVLSSNYVQETIDIQELEHLSAPDSESDNHMHKITPDDKEDLNINQTGGNDPMAYSECSLLDHELTEEFMNSFSDDANANPSILIANRIINSAINFVFIKDSANCKRLQNDHKTHEECSNDCIEDSVEHETSSVAIASNSELKDTPTKYFDIFKHSFAVNSSPHTLDYLHSDHSPWINSPNSQSVESNIDELHKSVRKGDRNANKSEEKKVENDPENKKDLSNGQDLYLTKSMDNINQHKDPIQSSSVTESSLDKKSQSISPEVHSKSMPSEGGQNGSFQTVKKMKRSPTDLFLRSIRKWEQSDRLEAYFPASSQSTAWSGSISLPSIDSATFCSYLVGSNCTVRPKNMEKIIFSTPESLVIQGILPVDVAMRYLESILQVRPIICFRLDGAADEEGELTSPFETIFDCLCNELKIGVVGHSSAFAKDVYLVPWSSNLPSPTFAGNIRYFSNAFAAKSEETSKYFLMFVSLRGQFHVPSKSKTELTK